MKLCGRINKNKHTTNNTNLDEFFLPPKPSHLGYEFFDLATLLRRLSISLVLSSSACSSSANENKREQRQYVGDFPEAQCRAYTYEVRKVKRVYVCEELRESECAIDILRSSVGPLRKSPLRNGSEAESAIITRPVVAVEKGDGMSL